MGPAGLGKDTVSMLEGRHERRAVRGQRFGEALHPGDRRRRVSGHVGSDRENRSPPHEAANATQTAATVASRDAVSFRSTSGAAMAAARVLLIGFIMVMRPDPARRDGGRLPGSNVVRSIDRVGDGRRSDCATARKIPEGEMTASFSRGPTAASGRIEAARRRSKLQAVACRVPPDAAEYELCLRSGTMHSNERDLVSQTRSCGGFVPYIL